VTEDNKIENLLIRIDSSALVKVSNSVKVTNKIIQEHEERHLKTIFPTVKIGNQKWMSKNLDVDCFANGDPIPEAKSNEEWEKAGENEQPAWCFNVLAKAEKYGKLYNWYAANDPRGLAPAGFHLPTDAEWSALENHLGNDAGAKMKSKNGWNQNGNGTNESGFSGLPGGSRYFEGIFFIIGNHGSWWSSSEHFKYNKAWSRSLSHDCDIVKESSDHKGDGLSVRCLRD
jgi:uncharacterized protein (TIGR02145 family)